MTGLLPEVAQTCKQLALGDQVRIVEDEGGLVHVYDLHAWPNSATELLRLSRPQLTVSVMSSAASLSGMVVLLADAQLTSSYRWRTRLAFLGMIAACVLAAYVHGHELHTCLLHSAYNAENTI